MRKLSVSELTEIRRALATGAHNRQVARQFGISHSVVGHIRAGRYGSGTGWRGADAGAFLPTEDEIAAATAKIREGWTDDDYQKRMAWAARVDVEYEPIRPGSRRNDQFILDG